ncbi:unnamed protein product [Bursaphelenchus okinawaensis]|uniref:Ketoreductase domain-containing protein n=1 Tax=Bursaphelenchus okinawaensis TaxID=465554 RepID=A0A811LWW6_9BILA|nr:unnamed protein product [Bursaphelenchus okinawaensis]CAG9128555.1 unnamed protein product [Bursaphelenchus okinawaensis]
MEPIGVLNFIKWILLVFARSLYHNLVPYEWKVKKNLTGKRVLLTGAASGIGAAVADRLAKEQCNLVLWDINEAGLKRVKQDLEHYNVQIHTQVVDLSKKDDVIRASEELLSSDIGDIDIVFNNAGCINNNYFLDTKIESMDRLMNVMLLSNLYIVKQFLPRMIERGEGHIVATCSVAGHLGLAEIADYCAAKFGVRGFMESLYNQMVLLGHHNIQFTTICPWYVKTPLLDGQVHNSLAFPPIELDGLIDRMIQAIKLNEREVLYPAKLNVWMAIKTVLPLSVQRSILLGRYCYS